MIQYFIHYTATGMSLLPEGNTIISTQVPITTIEQIRGIENYILTQIKEQTNNKATGIIIRNFIKLES